MKIPIARPYLTEAEADAAREAVLSGWVTQGPGTEAFEKAFASYVGSAHAVAVSSGTAALHLSLLALGIGQGDEVICPSLSFIATANAIWMTGATPVFAEVRADLNLDPEDARKKITGRTKAILLVHQLGLPADIEAFTKLSKEYGLGLVEDAACAAGSEYRGKKIGSHSSLVCFSFHPRKVITTGDGGMITTSDPAMAERLKRLRQHGMSVNDRERHEASTLIFEHYTEPAFNYRLTDIQASIGIRQLEKLDWLVSERRKTASFYREALGTIACISLPEETEDAKSNYQSFSIYLKPGAPVTRNELMAKLLEKGISTRRGVMTAHREPAYANYHISLPVSEDLSDNSILIPMYAPMTVAETEYVSEQFKKLVLP